MLRLAKTSMPGAAAAAAIVILAGCVAPGERGGLAAGPGADPNRLSVEQVDRVPLEPEITAILPHYNILPWLQFDMADPRPQGFYVASLYLISGKTGKGVFGQGTIRVRMYRVEKDETSQERRELLHTWSFTPEQALPWRCTRPTFWGVGYQPRMPWPAGLDILDRQVVVIVEFVRPDGKVVSSHPKFLKVPLTVSG